MYLPGINLAKCRWKLSKEVGPLAYCNTGSLTPPFTKYPVMVYKGIPGGSCMHDTCRFCSGQTAVRMSSLNSGTPRASVPINMESISDEIILDVAWAPLVQRLQWRAISSFVTAFRTASSDRLASPLLARYKSARSSTYHSKMHRARLSINTPSSGRLSLVRPAPRRCIKWNISRQPSMLGQLLNKELNLDGPCWKDTAFPVSL